MWFIIAMITAFLIPPFLFSFINFGANFISAPRILLPFIIGTIIGIFIDKFFFRKYDVIETFEHEFTHAIVAVLFLRRIKDFIVTRNGGQVWHSGGFGGEFGNDMIGLSPYFLPTFTLISALIRPLLPSKYFPWFDVWIGMTFGYHLWSTIYELKDNWTSERFVDVSGRYTHTDIGRRGFLYSGIIITSFGLAIHGLILSLILFGYSGIRIWWDFSRIGIKETYKTIIY